MLDVHYGSTHGALCGVPSGSLTLSTSESMVNCAECKAMLTGYWTDIEMNLQQRQDITDRDRDAMLAVIKALFESKGRSVTSAGGNQT